VTQETENQEVGTIMMAQELKLMLLRHWTLEESILNSNFTVTKLETWKEEGQINLKKFLANVGIPID